MRIAVALIVGVVGGLAVGYLAFSNDDPAREPPPPASRDAGPAPPALAGPPCRSTSVVAPPDRTAPAPPAPTSPTTTGEPDAAPVSVEAYARRIEQLEGELRQYRLEQEEQQGKPLPAPEQLEERFTSTALRETITAGLEELELDAEVTSVDCTEYPCILYGVGFGSREGAERLRATDALSPYMGDRRSVWGWSSRGDDGEVRQSFGIALFPYEGDADRREALDKRINWRVSQMRRAMTGP